MNTEKQKERLVELQGEFKKLRPPMFDGESKKVVESWLLNIKLFFRYTNTMIICGHT